MRWSVTGLGAMRGQVQASAEDSDQQGASNTNTRRSPFSKIMFRTDLGYTSLHFDECCSDCTCLDVVLCREVGAQG